MKTVKPVIMFFNSIDIPDTSLVVEGLLASLSSQGAQALDIKHGR